jgi:hypothetical protein
MLFSKIKFVNSYWILLHIILTWKSQIGGINLTCIFEGIFGITRIQELALGIKPYQPNYR